MYKILFLFPILILFYSSQTYSFSLYDGTQYRNRPDMRKYGIKNITILYGHRFWGGNSTRVDIPDNERLKYLAKKYDKPGQMIVLDIEHWKVQGHPYKPWIINESIEKYIKIINLFKKNIKYSKVGYFGAILPVSNYKASISDKNSRLYKQWKSDNKKLSKLAKTVDVAFPSVYTYSDNIKLWEKSFLRKIEQLKLIYSGKIFVFLWPQYFDHAPADKHLQLKFIPAKTWRHQLEFSKKHVDGVVIWGGWDFEEWKPMDWDDNAPWWIETKQFINSNQIKYSKY